MKGGIVQLDVCEQRFARRVARDRALSALKRNGKTHSVHKDKDFVVDEVGAYGEYAFAKYSNRFWNTGEDTFCQPDFAPNIEVRTASKSSHRLIVRPENNDDHIFVGCFAMNLGEPLLKIKISGYVWGSCAKNPAFWDNPNGDGWAYFVEQDRLLDPSILVVPVTAIERIKIEPPPSRRLPANPPIRRDPSALPPPPPKRDVYGRLPSEAAAEAAPVRMGGSHFPFGWNLASDEERAEVVAENRAVLQSA